MAGILGPHFSFTWFRGSPIGRERKTQELSGTSVEDITIEGRSGFIAVHDDPLPGGDTGSVTVPGDEPLDVEFSTDVSRVDRDWLWGELTEHAYWAKYRTRQMFDRQLDTAWRVVGVYDTRDGRMLGFCRAFSDGAALAYLADVYIHRDERGRGIGTGMLRAMIDDGSGRDFRWMLHTDDAHGLYAKFGFTASNSTYMEREVRLPRVRG